MSAAKTAEAEASQRWQQYQQEVENAALLHDIKERAAASKELSMSRVTLAALQVSASCRATLHSPHHVVLHAFAHARPAPHSRPAVLREARRPAEHASPES